MSSVKYLKDYCHPGYNILSTDLTFVFDGELVEVTSRVRYVSIGDTSQLCLSGSAELVAVELNDHLLSDCEYLLTDKELLIHKVPQEFTLCVKTRLFPEQNKSCMGLYKSGNDFITQCEPEGFRRITYYLDRPDILSTFTTTIVGSHSHSIYHLSNGELQSQSINQHGQRVTVWHDCYRKPSYLFALVVGEFNVLEDHFITKSNRDILLQIYAQDVSQCAHAMYSLKRAMRFDEEFYNLEYDLDRYMIVATNDFNVGAMENKGLNIFNAKYIVATPETATDGDLFNVEAVVAHEYFHNYTGNRVTCRDWFQLSLKEGLTVFRENEFMSEIHDRSVHRIDTASYIQSVQFVEDASALSHPVRPDNYVEIDNLYTSTVYEKGQEVVAMYQTIFGMSGFKRGLALYLQQYDGQAVTCEDFCNAMQIANNFNLEQFMLWYTQKGTPLVKVRSSYDVNNATYTIHFTQEALYPEYRPMLIPIKMSLIDAAMHDIQINTISGGKFQRNDSLVLLLSNMQDTYVFNDIHSRPIPVLLHDFSAPVELNVEQSKSDIFLLCKADVNQYVRFNSLRRVMLDSIIDIYNNKTHCSDLINIIKDIMMDVNLSHSYRAMMITLPSFGEVVSHMQDVEPNILSRAFDMLICQIGEQLFDHFLENYNNCLTPQYDFLDNGKRSLKNISLFYLIQSLAHRLDNPSSQSLLETLCLGQYQNADNMTDIVAVLSVIKDVSIDARQVIFDDFYTKWQNNTLVIDKWLSMEARSRNVSLDRLNKLMLDKVFIATNPNKIYALLLSFTQNRQRFFNEDSYSFIIDKIAAIDKFNPHVASSLTKAFSMTRYYNSHHRNLIKNKLESLLDAGSVHITEIIEKILM